VKLHVRMEFLKSLKSERLTQLGRFRTDEDLVDVKADSLTDEQLDKIFKLAKAKPDLNGSRGLVMKITSYRNVRAAPTGKSIGRLEILATALRAYIEPSPNKWLFHEEKDGNAVPYFVKEIEFFKGARSNTPSTRISLNSVCRREEDSTTCTFHQDDLGKDVISLLHDKGWYLETPSAVARYFEDIEIYKKYVPMTGIQFRAIGKGIPLEGYGYNTRSMERDGIAATVVIDDLHQDGASSRSSGDTSGSTTSSKFWGKIAPDDGEDDEDDSDEEDAQTVVTPVQPYLKVFDLQRHEFVLIHVRNLSPYTYDKAAIAKLVLPEDVKSLVQILVQGSSEIMDDIIQGKTGGTIVIATGPPGTGKTLTAEVFAEEIEKPLYVVQCSQLGTNENNVEKELQHVLDRASRWRAILLIDEADVYVHERGDSIQQNAIVGVFLRVLEHYRGVLFLTSNRSTVIDDAVMSRATAWIRYDYPNQENLAKIWQVLSKQYKAELSDQLIGQLVREFPKVSGRNVKNLLKLAKMLAKSRKNPEVDLALFKYVSGFLDLRLEEVK
jgi:hypothetical protein